MRTRASARDFPLTFPQRFELDVGPRASGSAFRDERDLRAAWAANRDTVIAHYAFNLHDAGRRPAAFWFLDVGDPDLWPDGDDEDDRREPARLRWLAEHDAFLPGELVAMRRRAMRDPDGYAADAVRILASFDPRHAA